MKRDHKITAITSTKSVVPEHEKRLMAMINGEEPKNEKEAEMKRQIEKDRGKGYIFEIPS